jgi:hypothetical protein
MDTYEYFSIIVIFSLISFCVEFLSDSEITENELKLGFYDFLHHFFYNINLTGVLLIPFIKNPSLMILIILICTSIVVQSGYLYNNEYCWITRGVNKLINPDKPNRKWRAGFTSSINHYLRGDTWAYSDISPGSLDNTSPVLISNVVNVLILMKYIITR